MECYLREEKKIKTQIVIIGFFWLQIHNQGYHRKPIMPNCDRFENGVKIETYTLANIFFNSFEFHKKLKDVDNSY